ncbi:hypothetical protein C8J56DRAFT_939471 [Mycena floridula]|nr:hypothetical protein C8J56DRAFT_939471 [Mycena floridula]
MVFKCTNSNQRKEGCIAIELLHFHGMLQHSPAATILDYDGNRHVRAVVLLNRDTPIQFLYNWSESSGAANEFPFPSTMKYRASQIYSKPKTLWIVFCGLCALLLAAVALTGGIYYRQERTSAERHAFVATDDPDYDVAYLSSVDNLMDVFVEYSSFAPGKGLAIAIDFEPDNKLAQDDGVTLKLPGEQFFLLPGRDDPSSLQSSPYLRVVVVTFDLHSMPWLPRQNCQIQCILDDNSTECEHQSVWRHQLVSLRHLQRQPDHIWHCRSCGLPVQCIAPPASCRIRDGTRIQHQNKVYTCYDRY